MLEEIKYDMDEAKHELSIFDYEIVSPMLHDKRNAFPRIKDIVWRLFVGLLFFCYEWIVQTGSKR